MWRGTYTTRPAPRSGSDRRLRYCERDFPVNTIESRKRIPHPGGGNRPGAGVAPYVRERYPLRRVRDRCRTRRARFGSGCPFLNRHDSSRSRLVPGPAGCGAHSAKSFGATNARAAQLRFTPRPAVSTLTAPATDNTSSCRPPALAAVMGARITALHGPTRLWRCRPRVVAHRAPHPAGCRGDGVSTTVDPVGVAYAIDR